MTRYVCGFRFAPDLESVLLIEKKRPAWQAGKLNGIGGHIEKGETPVAAMVREFGEETDIASRERDWTQTLTLKGSGWEVIFFKSIGTIGSRDMTDEVISLCGLHLLYTYDLIYNLDWIIPMHLDDTVVWPVTVRGLTPC